MKIFSGFPDGPLQVTPLADLFFTELLPAIDDLAELKVTLHFAWRLAHARGPARHLTAAELRADRTLMLSLATAGAAADAALARGLERACGRGTLLLLSVEGAEGKPGEALYFLNTEAGRRAYAQMERQVPPSQGTTPAPAAVADRANVFQLYEKSFGQLLTPVIAEELKEAEREYPLEWIAEALKEAAVQGKRSWKYARAILERWKAEGRSGGDRQAKHWWKDEYDQFIKR